MHAQSGDGPIPANIMLVGEAWGDQEERTGLPFQGASGQELNRMLHDAGIMRSECYTTNVVNARPPLNDIEKWVTVKRKDIQPDMSKLRDRWVKPIVKQGFDRLLREIHLVQPNIIVALGSTALWALTGAWGITKWRGSQLRCQLDRSLYLEGVLGPTDEPWSGKLIPILHPALVLRDYSQRQITVQDLKRVARERGSSEYSNEPNWRFVVRPSYEVVEATLLRLTERVAAGELEWIDFDLETRAGHIACAGISWTLEDALSIPFMSLDDRAGYWTFPEQEAHVVWLLYLLLTHPKVKIRGQNLLYDCQYTYRHWHFVPNVKQDTMIAHHSVFCGMPKSLDFLASLYCSHYKQWKPDKTAWKAGG